MVINYLNAVYTFLKQVKFKFQYCMSNALTQTKNYYYMSDIESRSPFLT